MHDLDPMLVERARRIRLLALDVDGVMTDGQLYFDSEGRELKAFNTRDGFGLKALQQCGLELAIITARRSAMVENRADQLGINHIYQGHEDKLTAYMDLLAKTGLQDEQICYAGDDWPDLPVLQRVGLAVTVPEADVAVRDRAHWITPSAGGHGAVRDICRLLMDAQDLGDSLLESMLTS